MAENVLCIKQIKYIVYKSKKSERHKQKIKTLIYKKMAFIKMLKTYEGEPHQDEQIREIQKKLQEFKFKKWMEEQRREEERRERLTEEERQQEITRMEENIRILEALRRQHEQ